MITREDLEKVVAGLGAALTATIPWWHNIPKFLSLRRRARQGAASIEEQAGRAEYQARAEGWRSYGEMSDKLYKTWDEQLEKLRADLHAAWDRIADLEQKVESLQAAAVENVALRAELARLRGAA